MELRLKLLKTVYDLFPFPLRGDIRLGPAEPDCDLSCVINFYGRINLLDGVLYSLTEQDLIKDRFEVLLIEDRGGTKEGKDMAETFAKRLNISYFPLPDNFGKMGYSRNFGLSKSRGKYILFLDDDTVILQKNFLSALIHTFTTLNVDAIVPHGGASYCLLKGKYAFHDPYYPTNRCMAYFRQVISELGGFVSEMIGQEDVEFVIRFIASGKTFCNADNLRYYHPPLIVNRISKAEAVGMSFAALRKRYPLFVWLMLLINGSRYLPLLLLPINNKWKTQGKFSLGFLLGTACSFFGKETGYE
jgi:glycosyltransferase involved in cell wall biosynthesis